MGEVFYFENEIFHKYDNVLLFGARARVGAAYWAQFQEFLLGFK